MEENKKKKDPFLPTLIFDDEVPILDGMKLKSTKGYKLEADAEGLPIFTVQLYVHPDCKLD